MNVQKPSQHGTSTVYEYIVYQAQCDINSTIYTVVYSIFVDLYIVNYHLYVPVCSKPIWTVSQTASK